MTESKKLLIGFGVVAVICCCAAGLTYFTFREFGRKMETLVDADPASVARTRENIAEFEIPPGYTPVAMSFFGYDMVSLTPENSGRGMTIMLMQYSGLARGNPEQMKQQLRQAAEQRAGRPGSSMQVVEVREETIRGEPATVTISEGGFQGFTMREWTTLFEGNSGPTILMVQGPVEFWDEQLLQDFIRSIH